MSTPSSLGLDRLLATIARSAPRPWYPAQFARDTNADRPTLERALDELRIAGLIELTPWEPGRGQGLQITPAGIQVLGSSRQMARLASGHVPTLESIRRPDLAELDDGTTFGRGEAVRSALLNRIHPRVTQFLIGVNVAIFLVGQAIALFGENPGVIQFGDIRALYWTGAVSGEWLLRGHWLRLLTCCFVHIGGMHLFMNMYSLWALGPINERLWGRWRYLVIYLLAGLAGSCAAMARRPEIIVAGASGCIWGLMAATLVWILMNRAHLPRELFNDWTKQLVTALVLNGIISFLPGISLEGHFGGGIAGAIAAALLLAHRFGRGFVRWFCLALVTLIPLVSVGSVLIAKDRTFRWHQVARVHQAIQERRQALNDEP